MVDFSCNVKKLFSLHLAEVIKVVVDPDDIEEPLPEKMPGT